MCISSSHRQGIVTALLLGITLIGCKLPSEPNAGLPSQEPIATVKEIVATPVWLTLGQGEPQPAEQNQAMTFGDRIATADQALAEVALVNGAVFRIGGDASLTLQPNQLRLESGHMITWVEGTTAQPIEIVTPVGIAGIRGTTVFVNIADDPTAPVEFFAWEGQVAVRLADGTDEIVLNSGEQLFVPPGTQDLNALQVQPLDQATARQRLQNSPLINGFSRPLPTRSELEATVDALE